MSMLVENRVEVEGPGRAEVLAWHPRHGLLAVGAYAETQGGLVHAFAEDGKRAQLDSQGPKRPSARPTVLAWHPEKKVLGTGWSNGEVTLWNMGDGLAPTSVALEGHTNVCQLLWSSNGFRILASDISGLLVVYKTDHRGGPHNAPFVKVRLSEPVVGAVLRPPPALTQSRSDDGRVAPIGRVQLDNGDSLDAFSRSKGGHEAFFVNIGGAQESATFFLGGSAGGVFALRESGELKEGPALGRAVLQLLFFPQQSQLIVFSEDLLLHQFAVSHDCAFQPLIQVKVNEKLSHFRAIWSRPGVLAMSSGESRVRLWDLERENNCLLQLASDRGYSAQDSIQTLAYSRTKGILAAGTRDGKVGLWRYVGGEEADEEDMELRWIIQAPLSLASEGGKGVSELQWSPSRPVFAALTGDAVYTVQEQAALASVHGSHSVVQTAGGKFCVAELEPEASQVLGRDVTTELGTLRGLQVKDGQVLAWDSDKVIVYQVGEDRSVEPLGSFACKASCAALASGGVYVGEGAKVEVRTFQGTIKQTLTMGEEEGSPRILHTMGHFLLVATSNGYARIYDLSRREAKLAFPAKCLQTGGTDFGSVLSASLNCNGTKVAYTLKSSHGLVDPRLYVYDAEADGSWHFNLTTGGTEGETGEAVPEARAVAERFSAELRGRVPGTAAWDEREPRLLAVHALSPDPEAHFLSAQLLSFFVTPEHGILVQDVLRLGPTAHRFVALSVPFAYLTYGEAGAVRGEEGESAAGGASEEVLGSSGLVRRTAREFLGLERAEDSTREAMLNFSFHLTTGNMDEAFKAIKLIKSSAVWENMAEMCVKTGRLDVAGVCLGRMGSGRGARMLRLAQRQPASVPHSVKVAQLAVQLGQLDDAAKLFHSAGRFDLLNRLYQSRNQWKQAVELASSEDRIHMRNTFYNYAQHLESVGAVEGAMDNYEKSGTQRFEVPRMLFDNPLVLEQYVKKKKDAYLEKWWAQYLESVGEVEAAREYYASAKDYLSVVRLMCYEGRLEEAGRLVGDTGDEAAAYHLARHYENAQDFPQAVHFFSLAHAYASAIRLCKEHGLPDRLSELSLMSSEGDMLEAARFYEDQPGHADKAVLLYHKAGMFGRALDLAFRTEQFSALDLIVGELGPDSDPNALRRCAEFFLSNQQFGKAAGLLAQAKDFRAAVRCVVDHNVPLTDELAELLTPPKDAVPDAVERNGLLQELADACVAQGHYHQAAKKFTQAGMKTEAMRALLKSGDTEKIVFFANTARSRDIYLMAGNYLQAGDWKSEPETMKQILGFYTKGRAPELLAGFYVACAQVEVDEYRDYEKALAAVQEAVRCLGRAAEEARDALQLQERVQLLNHHSSLIKNFLNIRAVYESDPTQAMAQLTALAQEANVNDAVRLGDIYAVLVIHNVKKDNFKKAHAHLEELRRKLGPKADLSRYVKPGIIRSIYEELNLPVPAAARDADEANGDEAQVDESIALRRQSTLDA